MTARWVQSLDNQLWTEQALEQRSPVGFPYGFPTLYSLDTWRELLREPKFVRGMAFVSGCLFVAVGAWMLWRSVLGLVLPSVGHSSGAMAGFVLGGVIAALLLARYGRATARLAFYMFISHRNIIDVMNEQLKERQ